jgi:hypothetical protein
MLVLYDEMKTGADWLECWDATTSLALKYICPYQYKYALITPSKMNVNFEDKYLPITVL